MFIGAGGSRGMEDQKPLTDANVHAARDARIENREGLHARPVMRFVDLAQRFRAKVTVANVTRRAEQVDGKSAMQMMLLEATQGNILRIEAAGDDAAAAVDALARLVKSGFAADGPGAGNPSEDGVQNA